MNDEMLSWMNQMYPQGFSCADLRNHPIADPWIEGWSILLFPLLLQLHISQLQDFVTRYLDQGGSAETSCHFPVQNLTVRMGDVVLKVRSLQLTEVTMVIIP